MVDMSQGIELLKRKGELEEEVRNLANIFSSSNSIEDEEIYLSKKLELVKLRQTKAIRSKAISAQDLIKDVGSRPKVARYETGVAPLDKALDGGIEIGSFVQLAGASFAGKTHLTIEILSNIALNSKVLFFNFEMGDRRIAQRFERSLLTDKARKNMLIHNSDRELSHIVDEIKSGIKNKINFFAIDSKMKIEVSDEKEDYKKFSKISATLSKLTQENEIIIFLINQTSEDDDKTGRLAFKGSGDQLYDTDLALFYMLDKKNINQRLLQCRKNRQDENNFNLSLKLDGNKRTVSASEVVYEYEDKRPTNNRYIPKPQITEYKDNIQMGVL